jgi:hypothetical protein
LMQRPEEELMSLCEFLGEPFHPQWLQTPFRKETVGGWRKVFSEADKRVFKENAGDLLVQLGYESDNDW